LKKKQTSGIFQAKGVYVLASVLIRDTLTPFVRNSSEMGDKKNKQEGKTSDLLMCNHLLPARPLTVIADHQNYRPTALDFGE
jgi:hypothetical protein